MMATQSIITHRFLLQNLSSSSSSSSGVMKQESKIPKGVNGCQSSATRTTSRGDAAESKSIFDISNDELMNFLTGNNESLNFLDIKEPNGGRHSSSSPVIAEHIIGSDRPRRTPRKMQAWVSIFGGFICNLL